MASVSILNGMRGGAQPLWPSIYRGHRAVEKFEARHNKPPDVILVYDDGEEHPEDVTPATSKQHVIVWDEDGDRLDMYRAIPALKSGRENFCVPRR